MTPLLFPFLKPPRFAVYAIAAFAVSAFLAGGAYHFYEKGRTSCQVEAQAASIRVLRERVKDENAIKGLSCSELRRELGGVPDGSDKCL
jgi:hypothetical protein